MLVGTFAIKKIQALPLKSTSFVDSTLEWGCFLFNASAHRQMGREIVEMPTRKV